MRVGAKNNNEIAEAQYKELWQKEELLRKTEENNNETGGVKEREEQKREREQEGKQKKETFRVTSERKKNGSVKT